MRNSALWIMAAAKAPPFVLVLLACNHVVCIAEPLDVFLVVLEDFIERLQAAAAKLLVCQKSHASCCYRRRRQRELGSQAKRAFAYRL